MMYKITIYFGLSQLSGHETMKSVLTFLPHFKSKSRMSCYFEGAEQTSGKFNINGK